MKVGDKFRGQVNNELFEVVGEYAKDGKEYFKVKHIKSGKIYELEKRYIEHLLIEKVESEANNNEN